MEGYINLFQRFLDWPYLSDGNMLKVWIYLLLRASSSDNVWNGVNLEQGQVAVSQSTMMQKLKMTRQSIRTCLSNLQTNQYLTIKSTNKVTIITICNYDSYKECQPTNQPTNQPISNQQTNQQEKENNEKKERKESNKENKVIKETKEKESGLLSFTYVTDNSSSIENSTDDEAKAKNNSFSFEKLIEYWNTKMTGKAIKNVSRIPEGSKRRTYINARRKEYGDDAIFKAIDNASESAFLNGNGNTGFTATFDWVFLPTNFPKVLEGNYNVKNESGEIVDNANIDLTQHSEDYIRLYVFLKNKPYIFSHMAMISEEQLTELKKIADINGIANAISALENDKYARQKHVYLGKTIYDYLKNGRF